MTKVLYVEHNDDNLYMLKTRLELLGDFEVLAAEDSEKGCKLAVTVLPTKFRIRMARRRQARREDRAFARLACHRHVAAHHARELARDGKAQPCPSRKSYPRVFWSRLLASVFVRPRPLAKSPSSRE